MQRSGLVAKQTLLVAALMQNWGSFEMSCDCLRPRQTPRAALEVGGVGEEVPPKGAANIPPSDRFDGSKNGPVRLTPWGTTPGAVFLRAGSTAGVGARRRDFGRGLGFQVRRAFAPP